MQQISESNLYYNITAAFYGRKGPETINLNKKCNKQPTFMDVKDPKPSILIRNVINGRLLWT